MGKGGGGERWRGWGAFGRRGQGWSGGMWGDR